jgi:hypothetical protein
MSKVGRNDACPCGSGKKSKRCCEANTGNVTGSTRLIVLVAAGALVAAIVAGIMSSRNDAGTAGPAAGKVWSPEHGHYHAP